MDALAAVTIGVAFFIGCAINAAAGGGSFLTFPILLATGLSPVAANATNNVAMWLGALSSAGAFRSDLHVERTVLVKLFVACALGSTVGALLLLHTSDAQLSKLIPALLFVATTLFIVGPWLTRKSAASGRVRRLDSPATLGAQFLISIYGGFFGAAMSIVILAMLGLLGMSDLRRANALKIVLSTVVNGVAVVPFLIARIISPPQAIVASVCAIAGGYLGAGLVKRLPNAVVRTVVIVIACTMTAYFTWKTYVART